jgi:hypothetical protein
MLAQSFAEYGALTSLLSGVEHAVYTVTDWVRSQGLGTWLIMGVVALVLLRFLLRRRGA